MRIDDNKDKRWQRNNSSAIFSDVSDDVVALGTTEARHWEMLCLLRFLLKKMVLSVWDSCLIN